MTGQPTTETQPCWVNTPDLWDDGSVPHFDDVDAARRNAVALNTDLRRLFLNGEGIGELLGNLRTPSQQSSPCVSARCSGCAEPLGSEDTHITCVHFDSELEAREHAAFEGWAVRDGQPLEVRCPRCAPTEPFCRRCWCTDEHGCQGGCWWVEDDLCSACATPDPGHPTLPLAGEVSSDVKEPLVTTDQPERRTKRRYAHDLYPHPDEGQTRPLATEVPYLYARALGLEVHGTGWMQLSGADSVGRIIERQHAQTIALLADALEQGLTGDEAWAWADRRAGEESGEWVWERAVHHGVDPDRIKPYPCGPTPQHHDHVGPGEIGGRVFEGIVTRVDGPEDQCPDCTEPVPKTPATGEGTA